jgi:hypothetical protein
MIRVALIRAVSLCCFIHNLKHSTADVRGQAVIRIRELQDLNRRLIENMSIRFSLPPVNLENGQESFPSSSPSTTDNRIEHTTVHNGSSRKCHGLYIRKAYITH